MEFSKRTNWDLGKTRWATALDDRRASGARLFDLTASNPTRCGFRYEPARVLSPLVSPRALAYSPDPKGGLAARQAVSGYYAERGIAVDPSRLLLTASTSEAYSFLFRLLADPGDEILAAQPSYPLLDYIAQLDDVRLVPYRLLYDHGWLIDFDELRRRLSRAGGRAKAIVLVHPNNPTGHFTREAERSALEAICLEHDVALIVDEVFLDYPLTSAAASFAAGEHAVPTFVLSGVSKVAALPQMKAAWIACFGPERELRPAIERLEVIADTFLSMSAPVECALPAWLQARAPLQAQIRERTGRNLASLDRLLSPDPERIPEAEAANAKRETGGEGPSASRLPVTRSNVEAGWYAVLRVPAVASDEETVVDLLLSRGVAVHPGEFYGFPEQGRLVLSLLPQEEEFAEGVRRLLNHFC